MEIMYAVTIDGPDGKGESLVRNLESRIPCFVSIKDALEFIKEVAAPDFIKETCSCVGSLYDIGDFAVLAYADKNYIDIVLNPNKLPLEGILDKDEIYDSSIECMATYSIEELALPLLISNPLKLLNIT